MRKIILIAAVFTVLPLFSQSWQNYVPNLIEDDLNRFAKGSYLQRKEADYKNGLDLLPTNTEFGDALNKQLLEYNPELCVELLFILEKPDVPEDEMLLFLYNSFMAISEQSGLEYYSFNRKEMTKLIDETYFVNAKNKKIDDPVVSVIPADSSFRYFQDDSTFGGNYYSMRVRSDNDSIWIQMSNEKTLRVKGLIKAVEKGGEKMNFVISVTDENLLIYSLAEIKKEPEIKQVFSWKVNVPGSFKRRISTVVEWYQGKIGLDVTRY